MGWCSRFQPSVSLSSAEGEYQALCAAGCYGVWLVRVLNEIGIMKQTPLKIYCDNQSAIAISENPVHHKYTKHIDIRMSWLKEAVRNLQLKVLYIKTQMNTSDIGTKPVGKVVFKDFTDAILGYRKLKMAPDHKCATFEDLHTTICGVGFWMLYPSDLYDELYSDYASLTQGQI